MPTRYPWIAIGWRGWMDGLVFYAAGKLWGERGGSVFRLVSIASWLILSAVPVDLQHQGSPNIASSSWECSLIWLRFSE